jgi:DNA invertase Pin-like site-specific DNA recombinase
MQRNYWKGKRSPNAFLNDEQVKQVRDLYAEGNISWDAVGKKFGVSKRTIGRIIKGESYV